MHNNMWSACLLNVGKCWAACVLVSTFCTKSFHGVFKLLLNTVPYTQLVHTLLAVFPYVFSRILHLLIPYLYPLSTPPTNITTSFINNINTIVVT